MEQFVNPRKKRPLFDRRTNLLILVIVLSAGLSVFLSLLFEKKVDKASDNPAIHLKNAANRLRGVDMKDQAALLFSKYLDQTQLDNKERSNIANVIAELLMDSGNYEEALSYLYIAEESDPTPDLRSDIKSSIVTCLEHLKKLSAARYALSTGSALNSEEQVKRGGKVVAKIGTQSIMVHDIERAIAALPPKVKSQFDEPSKKMEFARTYVAEELLMRKAQRLKLDQDKEIQQQLAQVLRQLLVQKLLEKELQAAGKVQIDDVKNYYKANKDKFKKDGKEPKSFEEVAAQVQQAYAGEKVQKIYGQLLEEALKTENVQFFPKVLGANK